MHIKSFRITNFRRLKDVRIDLEAQQTVFVGANNSGKTSATQVFQLFLGEDKGGFRIYDFSAETWDGFVAFDPSTGDDGADLPTITLDLWFEVDSENVHRVVDLLPSLDWSGEPVGVRMTYAPRDVSKLVDRYREAAEASKPPEGVVEGSFRPWPRDLMDYLDRKLKDEYEIKYYVLDRLRCDDDLCPEQGYEPFQLGTAGSGAAKIVDSLVRVDFVNAQRHLSDSDSRGRSEDLSKRLSRFYGRNLEKRGPDFEAMNAIADSEQNLNEHFRDVFKSTLDHLGTLGYPGLHGSDLVIKGTLDAYAILSSSAQVHYSLTGSPGGVDRTLPDQYNGLGFKNLIYMAVEVLDFHYSWAEASGERPPVHLILIEEPEAHLHVQLQQVFVRELLKIVPAPADAFGTQLVVTTHSPHIIYESSFQPIRYFCRVDSAQSPHVSEVKNLSLFQSGEPEETINFLRQYLKLTHCDLFFADAVVLVEGNVERLLLPLMIEQDAESLRASHLTILEVGGAFAHKFQSLVEFLDLPTLIVTDLDSVVDTPVEGGKGTRPAACRTNVEGAKSSNPTLTQWLPKLELVEELLEATDAQKSAPLSGRTGDRVRVAYQTEQLATWKSELENLAGRTLEEAFALQNLAWTQHDDQIGLGLRIAGADELTLDALHEAIYTSVRKLDKTKFALGLMASESGSWVTPEYIRAGLEWLAATLAPNPEAPLDPSEAT